VQLLINGFGLMTAFNRMPSVVNPASVTPVGRWLSINGDRQMTALKLTSRSLETGE